MKDTLVAQSSSKNKSTLMPSDHLMRITFLQETIYIQEDKNNIQPNCKDSPATVVCIALTWKQNGFLCIARVL